MLRAGGYFAWAAQPVYKHEAALEEQWTGNNLLICLELVIRARSFVRENEEHRKSE